MKPNTFIFKKISQSIDMVALSSFQHRNNVLTKFSQKGGRIGDTILLHFLFQKTVIVFQQMRKHRIFVGHISYKRPDVGDNNSPVVSYQSAK
jgi:hypothetical protein